MIVQLEQFGVHQDWPASCLTAVGPFYRRDVKEFLDTMKGKKQG